MQLGVCYYPEHWPENIWQDDARRMADMGLSKVRIGEFAWSRIEPSRGAFDWVWLDKAIETLAAEGLEITLGTPSATPPKWLINAHPDILALDASGAPRQFGSRRHYCFSSRLYLRESCRITDILAARYGAHPAITSWQTDNEFGCHDTVESYSENARLAFRQWLEDKYETINALNSAWGNVFWSMEYRRFGEIDLPNQTVTEANPSHRLDFQRFSSDQLVNYHKAQAEIIRSYAPHADITHNVMGHFNGFDHYDLGRNVDILTWDSYPLGFLDQGWWSEAEKQRWMRSGHPDFAAFHHDLYRGCNPRWGVMEQQPGPVNWAPHNPAPRDGMAAVWAIEAAAHGAEYCSYFRWRQAPFAQEQNHAGLLYPISDIASSDITKGGHDAQAARDILAALNLGAQKSKMASIALIYDYETKWLFDIQPQGAAWHYEKLCFMFYTLLRRMGFNIDIISPESDLTGYKLIVAPSLPILPDDFLTRANAAGAHVFLGPRSQSKTPDYQLARRPTDLETALDISIARSESLRPSVKIDVDMNMSSSHALIWRDLVEGGSAENIAARCDDGYPAFITQDNLSYLPVWPHKDLLKAVMSLTLKTCGLTPLWLPKDLRVRQFGDLTFAFNYGAKTLDLSKFYPNASYVCGSSDIGPAGISVWR
jgi:beta-galactosidase